MINAQPLNRVVCPTNEDLYNAIWKFFEFVSKYIHEKDKIGNLIPLPVTTKEDDNFAYTLVLELLKLIDEKLNTD